MMGDAATSLPMCLKCRGSGHVVDDCSEPWPEDDLGWFFSPNRMAIEVPEFSDAINQPLCKRCEDLDLLQFLHQDIPWESLLGLDDSELRGSGCLRTLGQTGSIVFWQDCSLCRCLFAMTPNAESGTQEVLIFPSWTINRLEGGISVNTAEKRRSARCLLVTLCPRAGSLSLADSAQRGDALCVLEDDEFDPNTTLSSRRISSKHIDVEIVRQWLSTCNRLHPMTCAAIRSDGLHDILLLDVPSRTLVRYPQEGCQYLALSYVWGPISQQSFEVGSSLTNLPQTIEDAVTLTLQLGKRYLWVDSLCINQRDEVEKHQQIEKMSIIYRGAETTIIALSGETANSGLARMPSNDAMYPQLRCCVNGKRLVGLMPTLSQQVWSSTWGSRAWTLQEALLSCRCLYISEHQLYFECNAMQCSESLNEARSWVHQTYRDEEFLRNGHSEPMIGAGVLRSPFVGSSQVNDRLRQYTVLANLYSYRNMTDPEDALNAFYGIIHYLEEIGYKEGFFGGLPTEDMNWALLWDSKWPSDQRKRFPTWSWAGWEAALAEATPLDVTKPHQFPVWLRMWKLDSKQKELVAIFSMPRAGDNDLKKAEDITEENPLSKLMHSASRDPDFDTSLVFTLNTQNYLFIEGIVIQFTPDFSEPRVNQQVYGEYEYFDMLIGEINCLIRVMSTDPMIADSTEQRQENCLLLARDEGDDDMYLYLLALKQEGNIAERKGVLMLQIPKDHPEVLCHLEMQHKKIILT